MDCLYIWVMEEKKKGGKRIGAGRKPTSNPKVQVTLYVPTTDIWKFGNELKMKEGLYAYISNFSKTENVSPMQKETQESPQTINNITQHSSDLEKSFQQHMNDIAELQYEDEYRKKYAEIEASNLPDKQKNLLYINMKSPRT